MLSTAQLKNFVLLSAHWKERIRRLHQIFVMYGLVTSTICYQGRSLLILLQIYSPAFIFVMILHLRVKQVDDLDLLGVGVELAVNEFVTPHRLIQLFFAYVLTRHRPSVD